MDAACLLSLKQMLAPPPSVIRQDVSETGCNFFVEIARDHCVERRPPRPFAMSTERLSVRSVWISPTSKAQFCWSAGRTSAGTPQRMADQRTMFGRLPRLRSSLLCFPRRLRLPPEARWLGEQQRLPRFRRWKDSDRISPALALIGLVFRELRACALIGLVFRRLRACATVGLIALASFVGAADFAEVNEANTDFNALKTVVNLFTTDLTTANGAAQAAGGNARGNEIANGGGVMSTCTSKVLQDCFGIGPRGVDWLNRSIFAGLERI